MYGIEQVKSPLIDNDFSARFSVIEINQDYGDYHNEIWDNPRDTIDKLLKIISDNYVADNKNDEHLNRIQLLNEEINKVMTRKQTLEMKWLDGKLTDLDHERLCSVLDNNMKTYQDEISNLQDIINETPDNTIIEEKMKNIRMMEEILIAGGNLTALSIDDEFIDTVVARITPCPNRTFKWYLNIGSGRG